MAVDGTYLAVQIRHLPLGNLRAYLEFLFRDVLPPFGNLERRAEQLAEEKLRRSGSYDDPGKYDPAIDADARNEAAIDYYVPLVPLRQTILNLVAAGLFHLLEQQLAESCRDTAFHVPPPDDTSLGDIAKWYRNHFDFDLKTLATWPKIDELRILANAVKHGEGQSAGELRKLRPQLFQRPDFVEIESDPEMFEDANAGTKEVCPMPSSRVSAPLAGADIYVTEELLREYGDAAVSFLNGIADHFEAHGEEYYPRAITEEPPRRERAKKRRARRR
jgi:hypothetical protein